MSRTSGLAMALAAVVGMTLTAVLVSVYFLRVSRAPQS